MPKKKYEKDEVETPQADFIEVTQEELTEDDISEIREALEIEESGEDNRKFVTGFKPNPPHKRSWWDKVEKKFNCGQTLIPINWNGDLKRICKVCSPGVHINTYLVKLYESRDETCINGNEYMLAPDNTQFEPYRDEYDKWRKQQEAKIKPPIKTP